MKSFSWQAQFHLPHNNMISYIRKDDNGILNKNKEIIPSYQDLLNITCPKCNCVGRFYFHGFYIRFLYIVLSGVNCFIKKRIKVRVTRIKCQCCGKTHAILHHDVIPYRQYALSFVIKVLKSHFILKHNIQEICIEFDISETLFNNLLNCFHRELPELKALFKGVIQDGSKIFKEFIRNITNSLLLFFYMTKRYFLHFKSTASFSKYSICHFHITFFCKPIII